MTTHTTPAMSVQEISDRVGAARACLRLAASTLIEIARAMGDERDYLLGGDDAISLIREAHRVTLIDGERWEGRAQQA